MVSNYSNIVFSESGDFNHYPEDMTGIELSGHAHNKMKNRVIGLHEVREALIDGEISEEAPSEDHQVAYITVLPVSLFVIVDPTKNPDRIVTMFYDNDDGAVEGSLRFTPEEIINRL